MVHLKIKPFIIGVRDWSGQVGILKFIGFFLPAKTIVKDAFHFNDYNDDNILESDKFTLGTLYVLYFIYLH